MTDSNISRRGFLCSGIAVTATSTLLAGCLGGSDSQNGTEDDGSGGPYTVSIEPMGEVTIDGVPETWLASNGSWADMGIALGQQPPEGVWLTDRYHTQYYDTIPGVSVDTSDMTQLYSDGVSKEVFYEIDADIHVMDPNFVLNRFKGMSQEDIDQIDQNIGPIFGNTSFSRGYEWHDYQYYTLYEAFEKLSKVFKQEDRYTEFETLHEEFQETIESTLPPEEERPSVGIFWAGGDEPQEFSPYVMDEGSSFKQWRDLGVHDALAESNVGNLHSSRTHVDLEAILNIDPEVLLIRGHEHQTESEFNETLVSFLNEHPVASKLTAVENDRVFRGGPLYQGPITNLVVTERAANQVYPNAFGDVSLFDPETVAGIVNGN